MKATHAPRSRDVGVRCSTISTSASTPKSAARISNRLFLGIRHDLLRSTQSCCLPTGYATSVKYYSLTECQGAFLL